MTDEQWTDFMIALMTHGWSFVQKPPDPLVLAEAIRRRYPKIPDGYEKFLWLVALAVNPEGKAWFLCQGEYNGESDSVWPWNECEGQSLEAAGSDAALADSIRAFWDAHLPIAFSVKGEYAYLALTVAPDGFGSVAYGHEPEYEDAEIICGSFGELTQMMVEAIEQGPGKEYRDIEDFI